MGDLEVDTRVEGAEGRYAATLCRDWNIWGPNGGYLAAVALRAVGEHTDLGRPASFLCHFLGVAAFEEVQLTTTTLRRTRRAEAVRVSMTQADQPVLEAMVWTTAADLDGLAHVGDRPPDVPSHDELRTMAELAGDDAPPFSFWSNLDCKPFEWLSREEWEQRPAGEPEWGAWLRFRPRATFTDPFVDAGRLLIGVDTFQWPAASRGHAAADLVHIAPSIDLACSFHQLRPDEEWLLIDATSPIAADGLVGGRAAVWSSDGALLASGGQQMLCRPAPPA